MEIERLEILKMKTKIRCQFAIILRQALSRRGAGGGGGYEIIELACL